MSTLAIGQKFSSASVQGGHKIPRTSASEKNDSSKDVSYKPQTVDMRNVSLNEVNKLIKSGVMGLDLLPPNSGDSVYENAPEDSANMKVDFLSQIEGHIQFKKSLGQDTSNLENFLARLNEINGMEMPSKIDVTA